MAERNDTPDSKAMTGAEAADLTLEDLRDYHRRQYIKSHISLLPHGPSKAVRHGIVILGQDGKPVLPNLDGIGDRSEIPTTTWRIVKHKDARRPVKVEGIPSKIQAELEHLNSYWGWRGPLDPEYNLLEPYTLLDTEAYLARALKRKHSLMFRNGVRFVGEKPSLVEYAERRASQIGYVCGQTFENLLQEILWNLLVCSNCILIKVRDKDASGGVANPKNRFRSPVAGYIIVPPHTIFPYLDGKGRIEKWRRYFQDGRPYRDYPVEDVVHFYWDRKPGHIFGTPRTIAVADDIYALRRLEENTELLLIRHLFPVAHIKVGTPEAPCEYFPDGTSEVDYVKSLVMNMPKEGVLVTDERVDMDIQGAGGEGVDPKPMIEHYKHRIYSGLGVSPIDMGESQMATRNAADNVSQALKDQITTDLAWFAGQVKMFFLREWFEESSRSLSVQKAIEDVSLEFYEIDTEALIREQTHAVNLYNNNAITSAELRRRLKLKPFTEEQEKDIQFTRQVERLEMIRHELAPPGGSATRPAAKKNTQPAKSPAAKTAETIIQPENQHGKNLDPHKARSEALMEALYDELCLAWQELAALGEWTIETWREAVGDLVGIFLPDDPDHRDRLCQVLSQAPDLDAVHVALLAGSASLSPSDT